MSQVELLTRAIEEWRGVPSFEGLYEISSAGRVRSLAKRVVYSDGRVRYDDEKILKPTSWASGHFYVRLYRNRRAQAFAIHRLMLTVFARPPIEGEVGRHLNDDPSDNRMENLSWGTHSDNMQDRVKNDKDPNGRKTVCPKGHPYDSANTLPYRTKAGNVGRQCRACNRTRNNARRLNLAHAVLGDDV